MRWDAQELAVSDGAALPGLQRIAGLVRSVRTPEFEGITFHEVMCKSALNKVPAASQVPFRWTINPYRGCSHACRYCLSGDTLILMGDGRVRPLADVRVGDQVYGTRRVGAYRRYVLTEVLDHWQTVKPAFRVELEDGTAIVASGDHRFLTGRGWKYVTGTGHGAGCRPHLTTNNELLGTGGAYPPPKESDGYRTGYLTGMIRGDAHLGTYTYDRPGRPDRVFHRFRLALADAEALDRTYQYLAECGIRTTQFAFSAETSKRRAMMAIRTSTRAAVQAIREVIAWPSDVTDDWRKGFLAGIFDAEGSCSRGVLRISNTDMDIVHRITTSLDALGFVYVVEVPGRANGIRVVRLIGGLRERVRFFHTVAPAISRKLSLDGMAIKSDARLRVTAVRPLGIDLPMYDISTATGDFIANGVVSHNCFARGTHTYLDLDAGDDFDRQVVVKVNLAEVVRHEVAKRSWSREHVAMGTNTDPYQRAEGRYRLMPGVIEALAGSGTPFSILTKGTLLRRDLPLLAGAARAVDVGVGVSLALLNDSLHTSVEPGTPTPRARLELIRAVRAAGLPCGVLVAPVLPGLTDSAEHLDELIGAAADAGATGVTVIPLHLRPGAREWYLGWLAAERPDLMPTYRRLYERGAYADQRYRAWLHERVDPLLRKHGMESKAERASDGRLRPEEPGEVSRRAPPDEVRLGQDVLF